jgi:molybdate transport system substrate-binding protein
MKRGFAVVGAVLLVAGLGACGDDGEDAVPEETEESTTLTVFAAASLTRAFEEIGDDFESGHDGVEVEFNFAGSSDLVSQIQGGAPADVFASADEANMEKLAVEDLVGAPETFATNVLEIAVPPGNPAGVSSLQDLEKPGINLVVCAPEVPCGAATQRVAENAGVTLKPVSEEQSVTDVLNKVVSAEADAGLVYVTDVKAAGDDVEGVTFPESADVVNVYPVATVSDSENADLAQEFMDLVLGQDGRAVLAELGFGQP